MPPKKAPRPVPQVDPEFAKRLAEHYAPEIRFDSREEYFPCGLDWLVANSSVWCKTRWNQEIMREICDETGKPIPSTTTCKNKGKPGQEEWIIDCQIARVGEITDPLKGGCSSCCSLGHAQQANGEEVVATKHQHRLRPIESKWGGQSEQEMCQQFQVPCYYSVVPAPRKIFDDNYGYDNYDGSVANDVYEITYYMIYAYNGNIFNICGLGSPPGIKVGTHEGDLEQVVIYVKDPDALAEGDDWILSTFQYRHAGEGRFVERPQMMTTKGLGSHFIVYPACASHASYNRPSWTCRIFGFANDRHNGRGRRWQTWRNLVAIDKSNSQPKWIDFDGYFGSVEGLGLRSNLGRPGFSSMACRLPAILPAGRIALTSPMYARKQIPKTLLQAVNNNNKEKNKDTNKKKSVSSTTSQPQQQEQSPQKQEQPPPLLQKQEVSVTRQAPTELPPDDQNQQQQQQQQQQQIPGAPACSSTEATTNNTTTMMGASTGEEAPQQQELEQEQQLEEPELAEPQPYKVVTFINTGTDSNMVHAELYSENNLWGPLHYHDDGDGANNEESSSTVAMVGSYPGHCWYVVVNGHKVKGFVITDEPEQTYAF